ncbi:Uncharacterized protein Adt_20419 [Abeliophyllum distichum]|uniref:Retrotransposon gag domain-containing protein n=1 Tax=Abeliophyllum distichum TaxID=126358 RepID=A0ABD1SWN7_9LAMI
MDAGKENPKQTRSFEVDDDDENLPFLAGIRNASIPYEFCVPKITPYTGAPRGETRPYYPNKRDRAGHGAGSGRRVFLPSLLRSAELSTSLCQKKRRDGITSSSRKAYPAGRSLKKTFINYFSSGNPASALVQHLHDIRQAKFEPLQSYLSSFNKEMLFCKRITEAKALSVLKGGLDTNLPFWRDVRNKNPTTFDQLVEMITEEITNENMILHRNCGGVAPNQAPRMNYGRGQGSSFSQPHQRRRYYSADPNSGISYVVSAQEGLLLPYPTQRAPGSMIRAYNYGMAAPTYYKAATSGLPILFSRQESPSQFGAQTRGDYETWRPISNEGPLGPERRSHQWDKRASNQKPQRRNSRSPTRHTRIEGALEHHLIKGPEKAPIHEVDIIYGAPYIGGQTRNAQKNYAKEAEEKLMTNWLINSRSSGSSKVDPNSFTEEGMTGVHYLHCDALVVRAVVARNGLGRMLVDNGSSVNVIFSSTYEQMNVNAPLEPSTEHRYDFTGDCITPKWVICLAVTMEEEPLAAHTFIEFLVVDRRYAYHGVLGRPALKEL